MFKGRLSCISETRNLFPGLKLGDEERKSLKKLKEEYKPLTEWFHSTYRSRIEKVLFHASWVLSLALIATRRLFRTGGGLQPTGAVTLRSGDGSVRDHGEYAPHHVVQHTRRKQSVRAHGQEDARDQRPPSDHAGFMFIYSHSYLHLI